MLEVGDLIFVHGDDLVSDLIEWAERGKYSHVAIYVGGDQVIEAQGGEKIRTAPLSTYSKYDVGRVKNLSSAQAFELVRYAYAQRGLRYDWTLVFLLFLRLRLHINIPYKERASRICCTFARDCYDHVGIKLTDIENCTPQELADSKLIEWE